MLVDDGGCFGLVGNDGGDGMLDHGADLAEEGVDDGADGRGSKEVAVRDVEDGG